MHSESESGSATSIDDQRTPRAQPSIITSLDENPSHLTLASASTPILTSSPLHSLNSTPTMSTALLPSSSSSSISPQASTSRPTRSTGSRSRAASTSTLKRSSGSTKSSSEATAKEGSSTPSTAPPVPTRQTYRTVPKLPDGDVEVCPPTMMYWSKAPVHGTIPRRGLKCHTVTLVDNVAWMFGGTNLISSSSSAVETPEVGAWDEVCVPSCLFLP